MSSSFMVTHIPLAQWNFDLFFMHISEKNNTRIMQNMEKYRKKGQKNMWNGIKYEKQNSFCE